MITETPIEVSDLPPSDLGATLRRERNTPIFNAVLDGYSKSALSKLKKGWPKTEPPDDQEPVDAEETAGEVESESSAQSTSSSSPRSHPVA